jgi:hypothetical protein
MFEGTLAERRRQTSGALQNSLDALQTASNRRLRVQDGQEQCTTLISCCQTLVEGVERQLREASEAVVELASIERSINFIPSRPPTLTSFI